MNCHQQRSAIASRGSRPVGFVGGPRAPTTSTRFQCRSAGQPRPMEAHVKLRYVCRARRYPPGIPRFGPWSLSLELELRNPCGLPLWLLFVVRGVPESSNILQVWQTFDCSANECTEAWCSELVGRLSSLQKARGAGDCGISIDDASTTLSVRATRRRAVRRATGEPLAFCAPAVFKACSSTIN